jgi:hypothetical protein
MSEVNLNTGTEGLALSRRSSISSGHTGLSQKAASVATLQAVKSGVAIVRYATANWRLKLCRCSVPDCRWRADAVMGQRRGVRTLFLWAQEINTQLLLVDIKTVKVIAQYRAMR